MHPHPRLVRSPAAPVGRSPRPVGQPVAAAPVGKQAGRQAGVET